MTADDGLPDSLRAFLGVRPLRFQYVSAADLAFWQANPAAADTVAGWLLVVHQLHQAPRILYRPGAEPARWLQFRLEPVGRAGTEGSDFTVDAVRLDPLRRVLRLRSHGHNGSWGGSLDYSQVALVDVTAQPLLLLKTETRCENECYGRNGNTGYNDKAAGSEGRAQAVRVQQAVIVIGPPIRSTRPGWKGRPLVAGIHPTPGTMLPAGRYRYQGGHLRRVSGPAAPRAPQNTKLKAP